MFRNIRFPFLFSEGDDQPYFNAVIKQMRKQGWSDKNEKD